MLKLAEIDNAIGTRVQYPHNYFAFDATTKGMLQCTFEFGYGSNLLKKMKLIKHDLDNDEVVFL